LYSSWPILKEGKQISRKKAKIKANRSKMHLVPYGSLCQGEPMEGFLKKQQNAFCIKNRKIPK